MNPPNVNNPFSAPTPSGRQGSNAQEHHWKGHTIRVDYRPRPARLWMLHEVRLLVDGCLVSDTDFRIGRCLDFVTTHDGETVPGQLIRRPDLLVWQVRYELRMQSDVIGTGRIPTGHRGLGLAAIIGAFWFGLVPIVTGKSLVWELLGFGSMIMSVICSVVAIRLIVGDMMAFRNPVATDSANG